jgi:hypothetical protein
MTAPIDSGEFRNIAHADFELRFCAPVEWEVHPGYPEGTYACVLRDSALATRLRDRVNHGRGTTIDGAVKSLSRKLLKLVLSERCPTLLASLVEHVGPREHDSRRPVTEMLRLALMAQWLCIEERRGRIFSEVCIRQDPASAPLTTAPSYRLDLVLLEPPQLESPLRVTAVEIKSGRADFSTDRKWQGYIGRADRLYFATLPGVVKPGELPDGVGLLELRRECEDGFFERVAPATDVEVSTLARLDLLYGLATCDRCRESGFGLQQSALSAVERYWVSRKRARKAVNSEQVPV